MFAFEEMDLKSKLNLNIIEFFGFYFRCLIFLQIHTEDGKVTTMLCKNLQWRYVWKSSYNDSSWGLSFRLISNRFATSQHQPWYWWSLMSGSGYRPLDSTQSTYTHPQQYTNYMGSEIDKITVHKDWQSMLHANLETCLTLCGLFC